MRVAIRLRIGVAAAALTRAAMVHASCESAFCALNSNWATQGVASEPETARLDQNGHA